jgi:hypothetical protein
MKKNMWIITGIFVLIQGLFVQAQAQEISVQAKVNRSEIFIGDLFQYSITIKWQSGGTVDLPGLVGNLGSFEVKDLLIHKAKDLGEFTEQKWDLQLSTYVGGDFILPPQLVEYTPPNDTNIIRMHTEPIPIKVLKRNTGEEQDILDIEQPIAIAQPFPWYWLLLIIPILLFFWWFFHKKRKQAGQTPRLPPYEEAIQALERLSAQDLLQANQQRDHFFALSEIIKTYLHREFASLDALDATSSELLSRVAGGKYLTDNSLSKLKVFCERGDLIKYSSLQLDAEECQLLHSYIPQIIEETHSIVLSQATEIPPNANPSSNKGGTNG